MRQSTFDLGGTSLDRIRQRRSDFGPASVAEHRHTAFVLARIDGSSTLEGIARELSTTYPLQFPDWVPALSFVCDTIERNS
jgi:hypothetical protein